MNPSDRAAFSIPERPGLPQAATCDHRDDAHSRVQERILGAEVLDRARGSQCPGLSSAGQTFLSLECYSEQSAAPVALYNLRSPAAVSVFFGFVACRNT